jgi:hypothetical protein
MDDLITIKREKEAVALNPNTYSHFTEHLAPLCVIIGMPLLLTDETHAEDVKRWYPGIKTWLVPWQDFNPDYLVAHFDVFFLSELWNRNYFYAKFQALEKLYQKSVRTVHCPHGFSDKIFWLEQVALEDISLIYGDNMLDILKEQGMFEKLNAYVMCGNYRASYYRQHQSYYHQLIESEKLSHLNKKNRTILYAPTRQDQEENTSFMDADVIFANLPSDYNLIVKLHPALEEFDAPTLYQMMGKYEDQENILFIKDYPLVYPLLERADLYLGDMSSVGYDFLFFNRPMFFLNQNRRDSKSDRNAFLYRCGVEIMPEQYHKAYQIIEANLPYDQERYFQIRQDVYAYTFGQERSFADLKTDIIQAYSSNKNPIP